MISFYEEFQKSKDAPVTIDGTTYFRIFEINTGHCSRIHIRAKSLKKGPNAWKQAVHINSDKPLTSGSENGTEFVFWFSEGGFFSKPVMEAEFVCQPGSSLKIWNVWQVENAIQSLYNGAAMRVSEEGKNKWKFQCNDGEPNDDLTDLVFELELHE